MKRNRLSRLQIRLLVSLYLASERGHALPHADLLESNFQSVTPSARASLSRSLSRLERRGLVQRTRRGAQLTDFGRGLAEYHITGRAQRDSALSELAGVLRTVK